MPERVHSQGVKSRFIKAIESIAKERYDTDSVASIVRSLGIDISGYYRLNRPNDYPTLDYCIELCKRYGIAADWLFLGEGAMKEIKVNMSAWELLRSGMDALEAEMKRSNTNENS